MTPTIQLINRTKRIRDVRFAAILPALQKQLNRDFLARWGQTADLKLVNRNAAPDNKGGWYMWLLDNSDDSGALGYHDVNAGQPEGKVFVEDDLKYGLEISVTISHEILEMLADPFINQITQLTGNLRYAIEVCDPVEADSDGYLIDGVRVSNFVCPAYFGQRNADHSADFDHLKQLKGPAPAMRPGGYILYQQNGGWHTITARFADGTLSVRSTRHDGRSTQKARNVK